jgi:choice-of-anchor C domain-containing protein
MQHHKQLLIIGLAAFCQISRAQTLIDGDFESEVVTGQFYNRHSAGETFATAWVVESGSIDLVKTWQHASGHNSVDLDGHLRGAIYQDTATVPGQSYRLRFAMAGNPDRSFGEPAVKQMQIWWGGASLDTLVFDTSAFATVGMGWQYQEYLVTATTNTTRLRFVSLTGQETGATLDDVSLTAIDGATNSQPFLTIQSAVEVAWATVTNRTYQVQWSGDVGATWLSLGLPVQGTGGTARVCDRTAGRERRFYRVVDLSLP